MFTGIKIRKNAKQRDKELETLINPELLAMENVTFKKFKRDELKIGLQPGEVPYPVNARIGPIEVKKPTQAFKNYRWCSCGMSRQQPFCDNSHHGTKFQPIKFRIEQNADSVQLCGWKLSLMAPFCDGQTCTAIKNGTEVPRDDEVEITESEESQTQKSLE